MVVLLAGVAFGTRDRPAVANDTYATPWGGITFEMSDRMTEAAGSLRALAIDPSGGSVVAGGATGRVPTTLTGLTVPMDGSGDAGCPDA